MHARWVRVPLTPVMQRCGTRHDEKAFHHCRPGGGRGLDRGPFRRMFGLMLAHHAHGTLANFFGIFLLRHGSIFSRLGISDEAGAVH